MGFGSLSRVMVSVTGVPAGPVMLSTALSIGQSAVLTPFTATILSPGWTPARLAGLPSSGFTTTISRCLAPSWLRRRMPTPTKLPLIIWLKRRIRSGQTISVYGSSKSCVTVAMAPLPNSRVMTSRGSFTVAVLASWSAANTLVKVALSTSGARMAATADSCSETALAKAPASVGSPSPGKFSFSAGVVARRCTMERPPSMSGFQPMRSRCSEAIFDSASERMRPLMPSMACFQSSALFSLKGANASLRSFSSRRSYCFLRRSYQARGAYSSTIITRRLTSVSSASSYFWYSVLSVEPS